jgi:hypothetical protein
MWIFVCLFDQSFKEITLYALEEADVASRVVMSASHHNSWWWFDSLFTVLSIFARSYDSFVMFILVFLEVSFTSKWYGEVSTTSHRYVTWQRVMHLEFGSEQIVITMWNQSVTLEHKHCTNGWTYDISSDNIIYWAKFLSAWKDPHLTQIQIKLYFFTIFRSSVV